MCLTNQLSAPPAKKASKFWRFIPSQKLEQTNPESGRTLANQGSCKETCMIHRGLTWWAIYQNGMKCLFNSVWSISPYYILVDIIKGQKWVDKGVQTKQDYILINTQLAAKGRLGEIRKWICKKIGNSTSSLFFLHAGVNTAGWVGEQGGSPLHGRKVSFDNCRMFWSRSRQRIISLANCTVNRLVDSRAGGYCPKLRTWQPISSYSHKTNQGCQDKTHMKLTNIIFSKYHSEPLC